MLLQESYELSYVRKGLLHEYSCTRFEHHLGILRLAAHGDDRHVLACGDLDHLDGGSVEYIVVAQDEADRGAGLAGKKRQRTFGGAFSDDVRFRTCHRDDVLAEVGNPSVVFDN